MRLAVLAFAFAFGFLITWAAIRLSQTRCITDTECGL